MIVVVLVSIVSVGVIVYVIGLNKSERLFVYNTALSKITRKNQT